MSSIFGRTVLRPALHRPPTYDGIDATTRLYHFACVDCGSEVTLDLEAFAQQWGEATILGPEHETAVRTHFDFNLVGKAHDGGWPRLRIEGCGQCGAAYLVYVGAQEPANGRNLVTVEGITELVRNMNTPARRGS